MSRDSVWFRTLDDEERALLTRRDDPPTSAEVVIVGAGLIGLATAEALSAAGVRDICVVDRAGVAAEASGANAGGLWFAQQSAAANPLADLAALSSRLYEQAAEEFDFELRRAGFLELLHDDAGIAAAGERAAAMRTAGYRAEVVSEDDLRRLEPDLRGPARAGLLGSDDGQIHPLKLAAGWVRRLRSRGVKIVGDAEVLRVGPPLDTSQGPIDADVVVLAAGSWTPLLTEALGWRPPIRPIRGALLALAPTEPRVRRTVLARNFYYWQLAGGSVVGGGSEEDRGFERAVPESVVAAIRAEMTEYFPVLSDQPIACAWSGFRPFCEDSLPVIGRVPDNERVFVAAGHFKKGVMLAPATGRCLAELILNGRSSVDLEPFDAGRFRSVPSPSR